MPDNNKPILIFTWGNPSRGDDAIGPLIYDYLQQEDFEDVEVLTDFQLQIEHATDLENRDCVLFVDASVSSTEPCEFYRLEPEHDDTYTTHAMSPASLLAVYQKINRQDPPPAFMLSVRGYEFGLGMAVSASGHHNLVQAIDFIRQLLSTEYSLWQDLLT
jgi:hydrogenase maturation protease